MKKMTALIKSRPERGFEYAEVPVPRPKDNEVLLKVLATTVCGSDLHIYTWDDWAQHRIQLPKIIGHEMAGQVVEVGKNVRSLREGDIVAVETHITCGVCKPCRTGYAHVCQNLQIVGIDRPGSYADFITIPEENAIKIDTEWDPIFISMLEPFGNAYDTTFSEPVNGKSVLVTGCGPIGLMSVALARAGGAGVVFASEPNPIRRKLALEMGADYAFDPLEEDPVPYILEVTDGYGVDVLLEMSGHPGALEQGLKVLANGGRVSLLGVFRKRVTVDLNETIIFKSARVYGITGRHLYRTWLEGIAFLKSHTIDLKKLLTHTVPLSSYDEAMNLLLSGEAIKVALIPESQLRG